MSTPAQRLRAKRQARWRQRQRCGEVVLQVSVPEHDVAAALLAAGTLTPEQCLDRHQVEHAISDMVVAWAHAWRSK